MESICQIKDIYKALYSFEKEFVKKFDMTINEAMLLCCMKDGKPHSAYEIAEFIGLSNSRVSKIIMSVEEKGWIIREIGLEDKRKMIFSLSKEGEKVVRIMKKQPIHLDDVLSKLIKSE
ncbi:MarR family transcriptional regulator [Parabacteroides sp. PF5-9]|uniref:MarR family winged helix-turn-helix transcriptional regulator n=1 Tax=Parabacteroides sp. PF5-9 TaxID=1742404 RepID=UPI002473721B|nr:MarR family transcriptional regulator [Parabacteroides sp. PF5-9]MDH6357915.1 DNA-binding MarR family transcriptional regulator [Parabacteroides sp. PF5-9]